MLTLIRWLSRWAADEDERTREQKAAYLVAESMKLIDSDPRACRRVLAIAWDRYVAQPAEREAQDALDRAAKRYGVEIPVRFGNGGPRH